MNEQIQLLKACVYFYFIQEKKSIISSLILSTSVKYFSSGSSYLRLPDADDDRQTTQTYSNKTRRMPSPRSTKVSG